MKVRFAHIWAEAYVPGEAYRGTEEQLGGKRWLALDPSVKQNDVTRPADGLRTALEADAGDLAQTFAEGTSAAAGDAILAPGTDSLNALSNDAAARIRELMDGDLQVPDVVGSTAVHPAHAPYLPSSLAAQTLSVSAEHRAIPSSLQARISFSVSGSDPLSIPDYDEEGAGGGLSYTAPTTDLANKRITLAYVTATDDDAQIIDAYHGLLNAPSYAASLIPVLRVGGKVVARGHTPVPTGYTQTFDLTYRSPGYAADKVTDPVFVGSLSAIGLDVGPAAGTQLEERAAALAEKASSITPENVLTDANGGEMLSQLASLYFVRNDSFNSMLGRAAGVHQARDVRRDHGHEHHPPLHRLLPGLDAVRRPHDRRRPGHAGRRRQVGRRVEGRHLHAPLGHERLGVGVGDLRVRARLERRLHHARPARGGRAGDPAAPGDRGARRRRAAAPPAGPRRREPHRRRRREARCGGSATSELSEAAARHAERAEEAGDCNYAGIVLMALLLLLLVFTIIALTNLMVAGGVPLIVTHVIAIGVVVDSPFIWALATPTPLTVFLGMALWTEAEKC